MVLSQHCFIVTPSNNFHFLAPKLFESLFRWVHGDRPVIWARATTAKLGNHWMVRCTQSDGFVTASLRCCWQTQEDFWCLFTFPLLHSDCFFFHPQMLHSSPVFLSLSPQIPSFYRTSHHPSILLSMLPSPDSHLNSMLLWKPLCPSCVVWVKVEPLLLRNTHAVKETHTHTHTHTHTNMHPVFVIRVANRVPRQRDILRPESVWQIKKKYQKEEGRLNNVIMCISSLSVTELTACNYSHHVKPVSASSFYIHSDIF